MRDSWVVAHFCSHQPGCANAWPGYLSQGSGQQDEVVAVDHMPDTRDPSCIDHFGTPHRGESSSKHGVTIADFDDLS